MASYEDLRKDLLVMSSHAERLSTTQKNRYFYNQLAKLLRDSSCLISVVEDGADISRYSLETKNPLFSLVTSQIKHSVRKFEK